MLVLMDGGSKAEINNFEEDNLIEPLDDVDQAVDNAAEDDLENISITCSENISRFNFLNRKFLHSCFRVT